MPRETKEEKQAREAKEQEELALRQAEYYKRLPERLYDITVRARKLGISVSTDITASGPVISFQYDDGKIYISADLSYKSEEWLVESVEGDLKDIEDIRVAAEQRLAVAVAAWSTLSTGQKMAIKEFIKHLP